jgi:CheY-like chemotaxis protein
MAKTLLLADDSVTIQKVVGISFASEDVTLITVDNGDDAISQAREVRPDAILADAVMPGKNGYEVCEAVKGDPELQHIPVLLLTGTFEAYDEERATRVGASGHVSKPFEAQTLVDEVKRLFTEGASPAAPATPAAAPATQAAAPVAAAEDSDDTASDSFDFFDDDLSATTDAGGAERTTLIESDAHDIDAADAALSLSDTPPPLTEGASVAERTMILPGAGGHPDPLSDVDQTMAIPAEEMPPPAPRAPVNLDDTDLPPLPPMAEPALSGAAADFLAPDEVAAPIEAPATAEGADAITQPNAPVYSSPDASLDSSQGDSLDPLSPVGDGLDFDFETTSPAPGDDSAVRVDSADLAEATVLDPAGASGFDVSSSDLGTAFPPLPSEPPSPPPAAAPAENPWPEELTPLAEPVATPPPPPRMEPPAVPLSPASAEPASAPTPAPWVASAPAGEPAAEAALSAIAPALREQLHDTLEKIAWESFSDVTEKIVRQAVEKLEAIAWEVIPQLAETLVREEIRRMKGESGDE